MKRPVKHQSEIPEKVYFRIGEVSNLIGVDSHVLRYWETEFKDIRPHRAKSNQRLYRRLDVEILLHIRSLLHEQGYTISGARKILAREEQNDTPAVNDSGKTVNNNNKLTKIKNELLLIQDILK